MARKSKVGAMALSVTLLSGAAFAQAPEQMPPAPANTRDTAPLQRNTPQDAAEKRSAEPSQSAAVPPAGGAPLSEQKMDQFVNAYVAVQSIQQSAATDLQSATGAEKIEAVKQKAEGEMVAAVERSGLAVAEFNQIVQTMQVDESVRSQIAAKVQARVGKPME